MRCVRLPRGAAWISISLSSGWASFASRTSHSPPPNSVWNTVRKFSRTLANDSRNIVFAVWSISRAACCSDWRAATRSSRCVIRNSRRFISSACSSTASAFTGPTASIAARSRSFSWRSHSRSPATSGASARSLGGSGGAPGRAPPGGAPRCSHRRRAHLPFHALLPCGLLPGLALDQPRPLAAEPSVEPHPLHFVRLELAVQGGEPGLHFRQSRRQALDLRGRVRRLTLRVGGGALGVALRRSRLELLVTGLLRRLARRRQGGFRCGKLGGGSLSRGRGGTAGRLGLRHVLSQRLEIGASLQGSAPPRRRATREEHGPVGAPQGAAPPSFAQHFVSGE